MSPAAPLTVACLCAAWCRTCDAYADTLRQARDAAQALAPPGATPHRFLWIDIEDHADALGELDVENFPTLLIARGTSVLFFGTVTPHLQTIDRLVRGAIDGSLPPLGSPPPEALALLPWLDGLPPL